MKEFRADLHCHSTCSDGTLSPEDLVKMAVEIGLSGLSITDHDTTAAYQRVLPLAEDLGLEMISGIEFSSIHQSMSIHVLAYSFPLHNADLHQFCQKHQMRREERNREILERLALHGMPLTKEELLETVQRMPAHQTIGRPHIAMAMVKKGYVENVTEAFKLYLGEGKSCYAQGNFFTTEQTLALIHQVAGLAVLAHPHLINDTKTLDAVLEMDFDGIECYYARFPCEQNERWLRIAEKKGWFVTGGSDFHGGVKPNIPLGCSWVNEETFRYLQNQYKKNERV